MTAGTPWVPQREDIIWIQFNPTSSPREMMDEHPLLVLSTGTFNSKTGIVIGLPMMHAASNDDNPFATKFLWKSEVGFILSFLPKSFDWRKRGARPHHWGKCPKPYFMKACEGLSEILGLA